MIHNEMMRLGAWTADSQAGFRKVARVMDAIGAKKRSVVEHNLSCVKLGRDYFPQVKSSGVGAKTVS